MNQDIVVPIITIIASTVASLLGVWAVFYNQKSRNKSQNFHDDMDTAKNALEIAERATKKSLELEKKVEHLTALLNAKQFKITTIFSVGEHPRVESTTIEVVRSTQ